GGTGGENEVEQFALQRGDAQRGGQEDQRRKQIERGADRYGGAPEQQRRAGATGRRPEIGPAPAEGHGAFEPDQGAEHAADHERTMQAGRRVARREGQAEADEAAIETG